MKWIVALAKVPNDTDVDRITVAFLKRELIEADPRHYYGVRLSHDDEYVAIDKAYVMRWKPFWADVARAAAGKGTKTDDGLDMPRKLRRQAVRLGQIVRADEVGEIREPADVDFANGPGTRGHVALDRAETMAWCTDIEKQLHVLLGKLERSEVRHDPAAALEQGLRSRIAAFWVELDHVAGTARSVRHVNWHRDRLRETIQLLYRVDLALVKATNPWAATPHMVAHKAWFDALKEARKEHASAAEIADQPAQRPRGPVAVAIESLLKRGMPSPTEHRKEGSPDAATGETDARKSTEGG